MRAHFQEDKRQAAMVRLPFDDLAELPPLGEWLTPKEAAARMQMTPDAFRATYCAPEAPRVRIWQRKGRKGGRRVLVCPVDVERLINEGLVFPVPA